MFQRRTIIGLSSVAVLTLGLVAQAFLPSRAAGAQITSRSLTLQAGASVGGSAPGGVVNHQFAFTLPSSYTNLGSIKFLYCTLPGAITDPCTPPPAMDLTTAALGNSTGAAFTGVGGATANSIYITRTPASSFVGGAVVEQLTGVKNPNDPLNPNLTFFVRIATYASSDASDPTPIDTGTVAAATATPIQLNGTMPESLVFCTGKTVGTLNGVPDCTNTDASQIDFDKLFSPTDTAVASSQMAASTNAGAGYVITVNGSTLSSGGNTVTAMSSPTTSKHGISQFGMNLMANTTPAVGADVLPAAGAAGGTYKGEAVTGYNTANTFKFNSTDAVADSSAGGAGGSDAQIFTVGYIVNVPGSQPAGQYATTLTYICTATF